jgi:hypothetical protein
MTFLPLPAPSGDQASSFQGRGLTVNVQLLIDAIVRQTTVLIAQLATRGGVRAPTRRRPGTISGHVGLAVSIG